MQLAPVKKFEMICHPSKEQFENLHLFYNPYITSGTSILKPDKRCIDFNIYRVKDLVFKASAGHKQKVFNKIQTIKSFLPQKSELQTIESYDVQLDNGWTSLQNCSSKQIYELLNSKPKCALNLNFKQKWADILQIEIYWTRVWKTIHENKSGNKIKSDIYCQLHLNFFTPFMAFKSQVKGSAICNLCKRNHKEEYHEILSCTVTKDLFDRFQILLTAIYPENANEKEMVLGLKIDTKENKYQKALRNFLTFTIRSIILIYY